MSWGRDDNREKGGQDDVNDKWEEKGLLFERHGRRVRLTLKALSPRVGLDRGIQCAFMASRAGRIAGLCCAESRDKSWEFPMR